MAVVTLVLRYDDQVWLGQLPQRRDAGGILMSSERELGMENLGRPGDPGIQENPEGLGIGGARYRVR